MDTRSLGLFHHLFCTPYADAAASVQLQVTRDTPAVIARDVDAGSLVAGFISPIDFARNASEYRVIPNAGVVSRGGNGALVIRFRPETETIKTLAVPSISASDIVLARLLMSERFGIAPSLVPVAGTVDVMLAKADAALIANLTADPEYDGEEGLDLVEEWVDATGLPYVHGLIVAREGNLRPREITALSAAGISVPPGSPDDHDAETVAHPYSYGLPDDALEGLKEFLQYAYFHGIIPDVPDIKFLGEE
jgi:predicted solute-binding protein